MSAESRRDPALAAQWRERFCSFRASGLTVREWCELEGVTQTQYYYWQRALRKQDGFISLRPTRSAEVRIVWPDGMALHLPSETSTVQVAEIVHALREQHAC